MTPFCKNFCIAEKFQKSAIWRVFFDFHKLKIMLFAVFQKTTNNVAYFFETLEFRHKNFIGCEQHCNLFIYKRKKFIGCLEIRFQSYLLNLYDLHMRFEYLANLWGISITFQRIHFWLFLKFWKKLWNAEIFSQNSHFAGSSFPMKYFLEIQVFQKSNQQCGLFFGTH